MATDLRIVILQSGSTSTITTAQNLLKSGELAYSYVDGDINGGDRLFIGAGGNDSPNGFATEIHTIGGKYFTDYLDHTPGTLTASSAIITDADNKIDQLKVDNVTIDGYQISTTGGSLTLAPSNNIIAANASRITGVLDPTSAQDAATKYYVDNNAGGFDSFFSLKTTDDLAEGSTNLYYTTERFRADFDVEISTHYTDEIPEGSTNLWFTDARARQAISAFDAGGFGSFTYNNSTGIMNYQGVIASEIRGLFDGIGDVTYNEVTGEIDVTTYKTADFNTDFSSKTTDDLTEGATNQYYTTARSNTDFDNRLSTKTTTNLSEGDNLYFTNERVDDRVANLLQEGEGVDLTYTDETGQLSVALEAATDTNIGGAKFDSIDFLVTAGMVEIQTIDCGTY